MSKPTSRVAVTVDEPLSRLIKVKLHRDSRPITVFRANRFDNSRMLLQNFLRASSGARPRQADR